MKSLSKYIVLLLALLVFAGEVSAKKFGGSSFKSSSFKSSFTSKPSSSFKSTPSYNTNKATPSSFKTSTPPPTNTAVKSTPVTTTSPAVPVQVNKSQPSSFKTTAAVGTAVGTGAVVGAIATTPTTNTPNSKATNSIDAKLAKNTAVSGKSFTSKADAESAYRAKLTSQNTYTSSKAPSVRPSYVPQSVNVGGRSTTVIYHSLPSGGYGYGYYDPMTHLFVSLAATHMILDAHRQAEIDNMYYQDMQLRQAQMRQAQLANQPVVVTQPATTSSGHWWIWVMVIIGVVLIIGLAIFLL